MIAYVLKVTLCWLFFYGVYELFLKRKTFFTANRSYLLITLLVGIILPLLEFIPWKNEANVSYVIYPMLMEIDDLQAVVATQEQSSFSWYSLLVLVYAMGVIVSLTRLFMGVNKIMQLYRSSEKIVKDAYTVVLTQSPHMPFSFFKWVFFSSKVGLAGEAKSILKHEVEHIKGRHSLDIIGIELLKVLFWCSPMIYIYKNALKEVHEFLADQVVIADSDKKSYKKLLLAQTNSSLQMALTHQFFNSHLKNRIKMINQKRSGRPNLVMYALGIPVLLLLLFAFTYSQSGEKLIVLDDREAEVITEVPAAVLVDTVPAPSAVKVTSVVTAVSPEIFKVVEEMPRFPGCEDMEGSTAEKEDCAKQKMLEFIYTTLRYPAEDRKAGVEGMAVVQFVVSSDGSIIQPKVLREISKSTSEEVLKVVASMGTMDAKWTPGRQRGKAVNVQYTLPVRFKIYDEDDDETSEIMKMVEEVVESDANEIAKTATDEQIVVTGLGEEKEPLIYIDDEPYEGNLKDIDSETIAKVFVLKGDDATTKYGEKGANGVVEVVTKEAAGKGGKYRKAVLEDGKEITLVTPNAGEEPLFVVDGKVTPAPVKETLDPDNIETIHVLKGEKAKEKYGDKGLNGVVEITTKNTIIEELPKFDTPAYFPGCSDISDAAAKDQCSKRSLLTYIYTNVKYPKEAAKAGVEGMVVSSFIIGKDGKIRKIKLARKVEKLSDAAMKVVAKMADEVTWEPAMKEGKAVAMEFNLPIKFKLADEEPEKVTSKIVICDELKDDAKKRECREEKIEIVKNSLASLDRKDDSFPSLKLENVALFPNPAQQIVSLKFEGEKKSTNIQILNLEGRSVYVKSLPNFSGKFDEKIDLSGIQADMLLVRIEQEGKFFVQKLILD